MKRALALIMALGLLVAFTSVAVAGISICGGPHVPKAQADADPTNTQQNGQIVVAQAEMTEDTSPVTTDEENTEEESTDGNN